MKLGATSNQEDCCIIRTLCADLDSMSTTPSVCGASSPSPSLHQSTFSVLLCLISSSARLLFQHPVVFPSWYKFQWWCRSWMREVWLDRGAFSDSRPSPHDVGSLWSWGTFLLLFACLHFYGKLGFFPGRGCWPYAQPSSGLGTSRGRSSIFSNFHHNQLTMGVWSFSLTNQIMAGSSEANHIVAAEL